ncbi:unnamed protein product [Closterium sp. NIES-54]
MWEFQLLKKGVPTTLYVDSMSTVQISLAGRLQGRMKHVDRRHMWLPDMVRMKKLELQHIPTTAQPADFFTKRLEKAAFSRCWSTGHGSGPSSSASGGVTPPPCPYVVQMGPHECQHCGRFHAPCPLPVATVGACASSLGACVASCPTSGFLQLNVAAPYLCWSLTHLTILQHHRPGHPSLSRLHSMSNPRLVSGLSGILLSPPPSLAPLCTPCVKSRLIATPHSSSLRPITVPIQTLHLDVWGLRGRASSGGRVGVMGAGAASCGSVGVEGAGTRCASSEGIGVGGTSTGGASSGGARAGGPGTGGARSGGAGAGGGGTGGARFGGAGDGGVSYEKTEAGGTATMAPTPPPHHYGTRFHTLR